MQRQGNGLLPLLFLERKANMSDKLNTLEALRLASLKAKGYTAEQIAELSSAMEDIINDINDSLKTCEAHVQSAHAPANAEENVIVSIQRNGQAIPPDNKVVNIEVPVALLAEPSLSMLSLRPVRQTLTPFISFVRTTVKLGSSTERTSSSTASLRSLALPRSISRAMFSRKPWKRPMIASSRASTAE